MRARRAIVLVGVSILLAGPPSAQAEEPQQPVRAVLFFSPSCGHCEYVIQQVLPPLFADRGGPWEVVFDESLADGIPYYLLTNTRLQFLLVDVTVPDGFALFASATEALVIGNEAVPRLVIGPQVMIGSQDIPARLPGVVDDGLTGAGIDWPDLPGLTAALETLPVFEGLEPLPAEPEPAPDTAPPTAGQPPPAVVTRPGETASFVDRFGRDPVGNTVAVVVLVGMAAALMGAVRAGRAPRSDAALGRAIPGLAVLGMLIAGYLAHVEVSASEAVCGPVGDCNTVQQSPYATVIGIPVGVLGLVGYAAVLFVWFHQRGSPDRRAEIERVGLLVGTVAGVLFSMYLTFVEPFVIGATCAWCLSSAVVVTALMLSSTRPGVAAWHRLRSNQMRLPL